LAVYLETNGISCPHLEDVLALRLLRSTIAPILVGAGLVELIATGKIRLAAVSIVAPGATLLAPDALAAEPADNLGWNAGQGADEAPLWDGTAALWYALP
jgi:hypothetical protein